MLLLTCVLVLVVLTVLMVGGSVAGPLDLRERLFLVVAPIPAILALVLPGLLGQLMGEGGSSRTWSLWLNEIGGWLSLAFIVLGAVLLGRHFQQQRVWDRRLLIGLFVAALPALLIGLVGLMYAI